MVEEQSISRLYRPRSLDRMFGQDDIVKALRHQAAHRALNHCIMFYGETGAGKTTIARIVANSLVCPHKSRKSFGKFCSECKELKDMRAMNILERNASKYRKVEDAEELAAFSEYAPVPPARARVIIVDEAQKMTDHAQNMLLKTVEEPADYTYWLFCTTNQHAIIPALQNRATKFHMASLHGRVAEDFLKWAATKVDLQRPLEDFIEYVHKTNVSSPRALLIALEKYGAGMDPDKALESQQPNADALRVLKGLLDGEWKRIRPELEKTPSEEAKILRLSLINLLRFELLKRQSTSDKRKLGHAIERLADINPYMDDNVVYALLASRLHRLAERIF